MKKYITVCAVVFVMLFVSCLLMGQESSKTAQAGTSSNASEDNKTDKRKDNQLYVMLIESLRSYREHHVDYLNMTFKKPPPKHWFISQEGLPLGFPFERLPEATFFYWWNIDALEKSHQEEFKKGVSAYYVNIKLVDKYFIIAIGEYAVKRVKRNRIETVLCGSAVFTYEYSCEKQIWMLVKAKYE